MKKLAGIVLGLSFAFGGVFGFQASAADARVELKADETEMSPTAIFVPDRCIIPVTVRQSGSGWYVTTYKGGPEMFLDKAAKHGLWNPKVGKNIDIMVTSSGQVVGWKVT